MDASHHAYHLEGNQGDGLFLVGNRKLDLHQRHDTFRVLTGNEPWTKDI